jgi:hypothetical protein
MQLEPNEAARFVRIHSAVLAYVNTRTEAGNDVCTPAQMAKAPAELRARIRDALAEHPDWLDGFVEENPFSLSAEDLAIVRTWKHAVHGRMYVLRHLKKYTVFLTESPPKAYGVLGLFDSLRDLAPAPPHLVETTLLPYKGAIIYDGLLAGYSISFGGGIKRMLNDTYNRAKAEHGIITSFGDESTKPRRTDADMLKFYLRTRENRERYWSEIGDLVAKDRELAVLFHQQMGKAASRRIGKQLRTIGIADAWFGILEGTVVAGGKSKSEAMRGANALVPKDMRDCVYYYHLKASAGRS